MYNKGLTLLLIFSLAFNIAFVGIYVYARTHPAAPEPPGPMPPGPGPQQPPGPERHWWEPLRLNPEQQARMEEARRQMEQTAARLRAEVQRQRSRLLELLASEEPDRDAIVECQERIERAQQELRKLTVEHMLATRELLTPEQRRQWLRMMSEHEQRAGRARRAIGERLREGRPPLRGPRPRRGEEPPDRKPPEIP